MPTSSKNERTRAGCWTCRARRKKCDETRPHCLSCASLGLECEGYGLRLKWGLSRAKVSTVRSCKSHVKKNTQSVSPSSTLPPEERTPNPSEALIYHLGKDLCQTLTPLQLEIMQSFIDWGATVLVARVKFHIEKYFEIFVGSRSLLTSCLAYQIMLEPKYAHLVEQYYVQSIEQFRREIADLKRVEREKTIYSGLVLCSISMTRGLPWTFHIHGIYSLLDNAQAITELEGRARDQVFLIAITEIPTHVLGRKTSHLNIWHRNCRFHTGVEDSLGLPCSLVDLLCDITEPDIEARLASWPGEQGTEDQRLLWDLTRHAGIIAARNHRAEHECTAQECISAEAVAFAVRYILTSTTHIKSRDKFIAHDKWQPLLFPLVMAASQSSRLLASDKDLILGCISNLASDALEMFPYYGNIARALHEFWDNGAGRSLERVVVDLDMELGLF